MKRPAAFVAVLASLASVVLAGCVGDPTPTPGPGAAAIEKNACASCHGGASGALAGADDPIPGTMAYGPNLTPDPDTGLGAWTDDQIIRAIRAGTDDEGAPLCAEMPRFSTLSDDEVRAIVAELRAIPAVSHASPESRCDDGEDVPAVVVDAVVAVDAPTADAGVRDAGFDAGVRDAGFDAGVRDAGVRDAGFDAGVRDVPVAVDTGPRTDVGPVACHPVINELVTGLDGNGGSEWIELYNPCPTTITLTGWRLGYRAASSTTALTASDSSTLFAFASQRLTPGGYLVLGSMGYAETVDARLSSGIADVGGVGLRNVSGAVVDSVGWGATRNAFVRGRAAPAPPAVAAPGNSIQRRPDGADTGDNLADFQLATTPTPRAANR